ncbi:RNA polymerase sigma-70 factor [Amycolatopsis sp. CA-230715]|uniref:RNA polymerase sigma-70 factor n=1 Tax=Amycolatopsis sp. CA-230715 TaxID=2745196 RepID=UPI001C325416|nr:RNA polymerase sigma-70 factor [Amycolatopsis sp. CA-230715]QWF77583.1 ECF RNA polymerase sigma factor SigJ [Amycolatopsis sp. CA-230715]
MTVEFEEYRPRLFGLAYRLTGSAHEAEDVVQDAFLRWDATDREVIGAPGPWLAKVVTNLCLNRFTSARARRERYVGPWLPEPVFTDGGALNPSDTVEERESVSLALLLLLERLTPVERAVFVLREAFGYGHGEVAEVLGVSQAYSRQLQRRAHDRLGGARRFRPGAAERRELVERFFAAARGGDLAALEGMLAADATWWTDGGGKVTAARRPVSGAARVARLLAGLFGKYGDLVDIAFAEVNGEQAVLGSIGDEVVGVLVFDVAGDRIAGLHAVANPDKLGHVREPLSRSAPLPGS